MTLTKNMDTISCQHLSHMMQGVFKIISNSIETVDTTRHYSDSNSGNEDWNAWNTDISGEHTLHLSSNMFNDVSLTTLPLHNVTNTSGEGNEVIDTM